MPTNILVIEDEPKVAQAIKQGLASEGWDVAVAATGEQGFFDLNRHNYDAVVLDLGLPDHDGMEILRTIRARNIDTPVLILTARDTVENLVRGLEAGADDYLTKPFAFTELLARIRAVLRRGHQEPVVHLSAGDLSMDLLARKVHRGKTPVLLTPKEFTLLEYLLRHRGTIVTRDMLAQHVWNEPTRGTPMDNVIDVHIAHVRKKIDDPLGIHLLHTIRGVGFVLGEYQA